MIKKLVTVLTGSLLIGAVLTGCSGGGSSQSNGEKGTGEALKPKEPVTLTWFNAQGFPLILEETDILETLKKKYPHITLNIVNRGKGSEYADLIAMGTLPDIIYESAAFTTSRVMMNGLHYDMQELVKKHGFNLSSIEPNVLAQTQSQNSESKLYGLPFTMNKYALFYNKDVFDRFGVAYPKDGMTWDDTYELSKKMTRVDGSDTFQGFAAQPNNIMLNNQLSIGPLHPKEDKATINNDGHKLLYENLRRFFDLPNASIVPLGDFSKGTIAMMVNSHPSIVGAARANTQLNWDVVAVPSLKERPNIGFKPATLALFVTQTSKHKDEAFEVVSYMLSEEMQMILAKNGLGTPLKSDAVRKSTGQDVPEWQGKNVNALYFYPDAPPTEPRASHLTDVGVDFGASFANMVKDKTDVNTALRSFEEQINQAIETAKAAKAK
ncbi:extracellular solute-binding protein [Paenibacillus hemerocallicola]|uniref:Extracellular solute-binding protein n=1 Tax=Paenibacillus hemerocallicola TaxID=1172614 RepID=A0A5C4SVK3_9BACL|nr:extracellular solute-binding protein [Paenibacillus hemerocallicola]TNJ55106.1 extracellular solute-binding protein [Paenibacillus hemerocallicola]